MRSGELHVLELLLGGEDGVDGLFETRIGLGAFQDPADFDLWIVSLSHAQEEAGRSCHSGLLTVRQVFADFRRVLSAIEALLELCRVAFNCFGMEG